jgi:hypothetical protein
LKNKIIVVAILITTFLSLSACSKLTKSESTLIKGQWELLQEPTQVTSNLKLLDFPDSSTSTLNFTKVKDYNFNEKKHELSYLKCYKYQVTFDNSGNILTLSTKKQKITYYRKDSVQYKKAITPIKNRMDSVNEVWKTQNQSFLKEYEEAIAGNWSNAKGNAQVNLNHDSPDPDATLSISNPKFLFFDVSFTGGARDKTMSISFKNKNISDAIIKLSYSDFDTLLGHGWSSSENLIATKEKLKALTFRDLFMKLGEVTLTYSVPESKLSQDINVSAYKATVASNLTRFDECTITTRDRSTDNEFKAYLTPVETTN